MDFIEYAVKNNDEIREHLYEIPEYEPKVDRLRRLAAVDEPLAGKKDDEGSGATRRRLSDMLEGMDDDMKRELVKGAMQLLPPKLSGKSPHELRAFLTEKLDKYEGMEKNNDTGGIEKLKEEMRDMDVQDEHFDFIVQNREMIRSLMPFIDTRLRRLSVTTPPSTSTDGNAALQEGPQSDRERTGGEAARRRLIQIFYPEIPEFDPGPKDECRNILLQTLALVKMEMPGVVESYHRQCYDIHLQNVKREQFKSVDNAQPPRTFSWQVEENLVHMASRWDIRKTFIQVFDELYKQFNSVAALYMNEKEPPAPEVQTPQELEAEQAAEKEIEEAHKAEANLVRSVTHSALSDPQGNAETQEE